MAYQNQKYVVSLEWCKFLALRKKTQTLIIHDEFILKRKLNVFFFLLQIYMHIHFKNITSFINSERLTKLHLKNLLNIHSN